jgi:hypothetical protein
MKLSIMQSRRPSHVLCSWVLQVLWDSQRASWSSYDLTAYAQIRAKIRRAEPIDQEGEVSNGNSNRSPDHRGQWQSCDIQWRTVCHVQITGRNSDKNWDYLCWRMLLRYRATRVVRCESNRWPTSNCQFKTDSKTILCICFVPLGEFVRRLSVWTATDCIHWHWDTMLITVRIEQPLTGVSHSSRHWFVRKLFVGLSV